MYIYLDESGDLGWSNRRTQPFFVLVALVIKDKPSKKAIANAITRATVELRKKRQANQRDTVPPIAEIKGYHLRKHPRARLRLIKRMARRGRFDVRAFVVDKRVITQFVSRDYMRRYAVCAMNLLSQVQIPRNQKWVTLVVDSQARAQPTQPVRVKYHSKRHRKLQASLRRQDRYRQKRLEVMVSGFFRQYLKRKGTHLAVWQRRSVEDRCIQAADVLANFVYERCVLDERRAEIFSKLTYKQKSRQALANNREWLRCKHRRENWFRCLEAFGAHRPQLLRARVLYRKRIRTAVMRMLRHKKLEGNRGA